MPAPSKLAAALAEQADSNRSALGHEADFAEHRARLTREILERAPAGGQGRLCLLGAGNANDVELARLADAFREVHLVDVDAAAVAHARGRLEDRLRRKVIERAPFEVSGLFAELEGWAAAPPGAAAIGAAARAGVERVVAGLGGPFEVVVSCALLTQLQLVLLQVLGDQHPRFFELRAAMSAAHVRVLCGLLPPGGVALLVTDLTSSDTFPFANVAPDADLGALMSTLVHVGNLIYVSHPGQLSAEVRRDPALRDRFAVHFPVGPWLWHNGPEKIFLVYALEITARAAPATVTAAPR